MDDNERNSLVNRIAKLDVAIEDSIKNMEAGEAAAKTFRGKRNRLRMDRVALNRRLKED